MANHNLSNAKKAKNDEFYTQYHDIEKEIAAYIEYNPDVFRDKTVFLPCDDPEWSNFTKFFAQNFESFGLRKLISTSFAAESKNYKSDYQPTLFETNSVLYDKEKTTQNGKIFTLTRDASGDGKVDVDDLEWQYLEGDGDFRSIEMKRLRDGSDFIITNPPFSLFRPFLKWVVESGKKFVFIGNKSCVTYQEVFPLFKENKMWSGRTEWSGGMWFETKNPDDVDKVVNGVNMKNVSSFWFTNIDHGRRHQPLPLMTMADNLRYSKHKEVKDKESYDRYDNYDAIEVPYTDAIPSDYKGVMGVPITFLDKYSPEQFEIIGMSKTPIGTHLRTKEYPKQVQIDKHGKRSKVTKLNDGAAIEVNFVPIGKTYYEVDDKKYIATFPRVLIKHRKV